MLDTIAAISTPRGKGGVAMIRISGGETRSIIERVFAARGRTKPTDCARRAVFGDILCGERVVDSGICTFFAEGASFTGEDVAEICCHGGIAVTARVLEAVLAAGASLAPPGEFTRRAFINGKLTLSEADAVGLLIDADTEERAELAASAASGALSRELSAIGESVSISLAQLYAAIDYPDEDIGEISPGELADSFDDAIAKLDRLASSYRRGSAIVDGVPTAIVGAPNAGKSSLYNALCGQDAAIVTDVAGTTRDVLSATVSFGGVTLLLRDTAGIRESDDEVERLGIERAKGTADTSALVLFVYDLSRKITADELAYAEKFRRDHPNAATIAVMNKSDLARAMDESDEAAIRELHTQSVEISAKEGESLDELAAIVGRLYDAGTASASDAVLWSAAQLGAVRCAGDLLSAARDALRSGDMPDAACTMAESALESLWQIDGRGVSEEIVSAIFSRFCVGK